MKKKRIDGDVPADLITNIVATITEPEQMVGPDVSLSSDALICVIHCKFTEPEQMLGPVVSLSNTDQVFM